MHISGKGWKGIGIGALILTIGSTVLCAFKPINTSIFGAYKYSLPCPDCPGVESTITIECTTPCTSGKYFQRDDPANTMTGEGTQEFNGTWKVIPNGLPTDSTQTVIALTDTEKVSKPVYYLFTKEYNLELLDKNKNRLPTQFRQVFKKLP